MGRGFGSAGARDRRSGPRRRLRRIPRRNSRDGQRWCSCTAREGVAGFQNRAFCGPTVRDETLLIGAGGGLKNAPRSCSGPSAKFPSTRARGYSTLNAARLCRMCKLPSSGASCCSRTAIRFSTPCTRARKAKRDSTSICRDGGRS